MGFYRGPNIVKDGLVLHLDAANYKSYPGSGTTWSDLSGNGNNGTLTNGPTFDSGNRGSIVFDGSNDFVYLSNPSSLAFGTGDFSIEIWCNPDSINEGPSEQNTLVSKDYRNIELSFYLGTTAGLCPDHALL